MGFEINGAQRPFWMHQIVEYLIGAVFISSGFQSATPVVPAGLGAAVMLNAAFSDGPGGAFRVMHRQVHRIIDVVIIAAVFVVAVQPVVSIDGNSRILAVALGVVLVFVWWNTDFATKEQRKARRDLRKAQRVKIERPSSEELGKSAGRTVAKGVNAARRMKDQLRSDDTPSAESDAGHDAGSDGGSAAGPDADSDGRSAAGPGDGPAKASDI